MIQGKEIIFRFFNFDAEGHILYKYISKQMLNNSDT